jgi:Amidohydrolase
VEVLDCQVHAAVQAAPVSSWAPGVDQTTRDQIGVRMTEQALRAAGVDGAIINWTPAFMRVAYETFPARFRGCLQLAAPGTATFDMMHSGMQRSRINEAESGSAIDIDDAEGGMLAVADDVDLLANVKALQANAGLVSLRIMCGFLPGVDTSSDFRALEHGGYDKVFDTARMAEMPVCVWAAGCLDVLAKVAERFSDVTIVVDHLGLVPRPFSSSPLDDLPTLLALAHHPNIVVKLSGAVDVSSEAYPFRDAQTAIRRVVDGFGPERVMWGSDFTAHPGHSYSDARTFLRDADGFDETEKEWMFSAALRRVFRWPTGE